MDQSIQKPWHRHLKDLEDDTNAILDKYGSTKRKKRRQRSYIIDPLRESSNDDCKVSTKSKSFEQSDNSAKHINERDKNEATEKVFKSKDRDGSLITNVHNSNRKIERYFNEDGTSNVHLRDAISKALKNSKFDSVATILATANTTGSCSCNQNPSYIDNDDLKKEKTSSIYASHDTNNIKNLALRDIAYDGFETRNRKCIDENQSYHGLQTSVDEQYDLTRKEICFNCWSAKYGNGCQLERYSDEPLDDTRSLLLCSKWGIETLRKKYRSQTREIGSKSHMSSLRFAQGSKRRSVVQENSHPIFISLSKHLFLLNTDIRRRSRVHQWLKSIVDAIKLNLVPGFESTLKRRKLIIKASRRNYILLRNITKSYQSLLPIGTTTLNDRAKESDKNTIIIGKKGDNASSAKTYVISGPMPTSESLYKPRKYSVPAIVTTKLLSVDDNNSLVNIDNGNITVLRTTTMASLGKKETLNNMAVGGLSTWITLSRNINTPINPKYDEFNDVDKYVFTPEAETSLTFPIVPLSQEPQKYVERELVHILNYRRPPSIMIKTGISPYEKNYFGLNRPEQTGECDYQGFRTSESAPCQTINSDISTKTFVPAESIASLNKPSELPTITTRADINYDFCATNSRKNSINDLKYILDSTEVSSRNKPQLFTVLTNQEPGNFLRNCKPDHPLGRLRTVVIRSWSFLQRNRTQIYFTEKGIPYWYERRTGQIFWKRPMFDEETIPLKQGGVRFKSRGGYYANQLGDRNPDSNTSNRSKLRKTFLTSHETEDSRLRRIKLASYASTELIDEDYVKHDNFEELDQKVIDNTSDPVKKYKANLKKTTATTQDNEDFNLRRMQLTSAPTELKHDDSLRKSYTNRRHIDHTVTDTSSNTVAETTFQEVNLTDKCEINKYNDATDKSTFQADEHSQKQMRSELLITSISRAISENINSFSSSEDFLKLGVGIGMSLGSQGLLNLEDIMKGQEQSGSDISLKSTEITSEIQPCDEDVGGLEKVVGTLSISVDIEKDDLSGHFDPASKSTPSSQSIKADEPYLFREDLLELETSITCSDDSQKLCKGTNIELILEERQVGFIEALSLRRVDKQYDQNQKLPQSKPVGRIKPRSTGKDWLLVGFDPWSAGKDLLSFEFISSMTLSKLSLSTDKWQISSEIDLSDYTDLEGLTIQEKEMHVANKIRDDFLHLCKIARHGTCQEFEELLFDPDWTVPIDYVDHAGNTILIICCQNGSKRKVKSCLRKGSNVNKQNINGHTCLHYAFGYGFDDLGDYLKLKGANDTLTNADGLTCYEGFTIEDISAI